MQYHNCKLLSLMEVQNSLPFLMKLLGFHFGHRKMAFDEPILHYVSYRRPCQLGYLLSLCKNKNIIDRTHCDGFINKHNLLNQSTSVVDNEDVHNINEYKDANNSFTDKYYTFQVCSTLLIPYSNLLVLNISLYGVYQFH